MTSCWVFQTRSAAGQAGASALGLVLVLLTLALRIHLNPDVNDPSLVFFVPAILFVSSVGGMPSGLFTTLISCACSEYFLLHPLNSFWINSPLEALDLAALATTGLFISLICQLLRETIQQSDAANAKLASAHKAADLLAAIVNSSTEGIVGVSHDGIITSWNNAAQRIFGYSAEEAIGVPALVFAEKFVPSAVRAKERKAIARILEGHAVEPLETIRIRKDGSPIDVRVAISPIQDAQGRFLGISTSIQDITEQKRAGEALRVSEERLDLALDSAMMGAWEHDYANDCAYWYPQVYKLLGLPKGSGIEPPSRLFDHVHPDDLPGLKAAMANIMGADWFYEFRIIKPGGEVRWLVSQGRLSRNAKGRPASLRGICYDITERKQAEAEIRSSRTKLAAALASMADGVFISDMDGNFTHLNEAFAKFHRFPSVRACLRTLKEYPAILEVLTPDGERVSFDDWPINRALRGETATGVEHMLRRKDTGETWFGTYNLAPIRGVDGKAIGIVMSMRDETEKLRAELALRRSEEQYRELYENLRDGFAQVDLDGEITAANREFCRMLGYRPDELRQLSYSDITPERWHQSDEAILKDQILARGYSDVYEKEYRRKDGTIFPVELRTVLSRDKDGHPESMWAVVRDISDRKAAEARLQRLRHDLVQVGRMNELGHVSSGIAHELNQPLAAMLNYANAAKRLLARRDTKSIEAAHAALSKATEQAARAGDIVLRMRSLIEKWQGNRRIEDINAIINDAVALETADAQPGDVAIRLCLAEHPPPVLADRTQIQHVLANLLRNAFDALAGSSCREITISSAVVDHSEIEVVVADTGRGIPQDMADRLFMPFFTTKAAGMGIGLVISQSIIEAHGGRISVRPNTDGGTVIQFRLPVASGAHERHAA